MPELAVVKVGGSLFSHPRLGPGLRDWLASRPDERSLLVPGGAAMADAVRDFHRAHGLDQQTCHWLALRTLTVSAHFLAALLPGSVVVPDAEPDALAAAGRVMVLDAHSFALADEGRAGSLEHTWRVTSDSIAARAARVARAARLILLKSTRTSPFVSWEDAAERGWVDAAFPASVHGLGRVEAIDFRSRLGHGG